MKLAPRTAESALVAVALAVAIGFFVREPGRLPTDREWRDAAARIASQAREGDAVLLDPHWAERARLFLDAKPPVLNLGRHVTREDLVGYDRLFLLSLPRLPRSTTDVAKRTLESFGFLSAGPPEGDRIAVSLYVNPHPERPTLRLSERLDRARVFIRRLDGTEEDCPFTNGRHRCARAGWLQVAAETREIDGKPFDCIYAHAVGKEPLVVAFPDVTLGDSLRFVGGIVGQVVYRHERYAPVDVDLVAGQARIRLAFPPGEPGERRATLDTTAGAVQEVRVELTAENPDQRHFCFEVGVYP